MPESIRMKAREMDEDDLVLQVKDPVEALRMLAYAEMKPFAREDWYGFSGCETKDPMIGRHEKFTIVLDNAILNILHDEDIYGGTLFQLKEI